MLHLVLMIHITYIHALTSPGLMLFNLVSQTKPSLSSIDQSVMTSSGISAQPANTEWASKDFKDASLSRILSGAYINT